MGLALRSLDALSAVEAGIDGPRSRSYHRQRGTQNRQHDVNRGIADTREDDPQLNHTDQRPHHGVHNRLGEVSQRQHLLFMSNPLSWRDCCAAVKRLG